MKRLPRISQITAKEKPYIIITIWTNGEERKTDLEPVINSYESLGDSRFTPLRDWNTFIQVSVSPEHTLCWENLPQEYTLPSGKVLSGALDLDPDTLYKESELLGTVGNLPKVGELLKKAREEAGLSQGDVAAASGTTRGYISRVENGRTDIQINTLYKLIRLGIGKELRLNII